MRIGEGTVEQVLDDGLAKVRVSKDYLYVACSACAAADHVMVTAHNHIGAEEGNRVRYTVDDSHLAMSSFVCFILPLIAMAVGGFFGYTVGASVAAGIIGTCIGLVVGAVGVKAYDKSLGSVVDARATIMEVLVDDDTED